MNIKIVATFIYEKIICRFGLLKVLQSNRKTHFVNEIIQKLTKRFRIRHSLSLLYYLQSNGLVKRFNKMLCKRIVKVVEEIKFWDKYIQLVLFIYRIKELRISKQSSYKLIYRRELILIIDYRSHKGIIIKKLLKITNKVP